MALISISLGQVQQQLKRCCMFTRAGVPNAAPGSSAVTGAVSLGQVLWTQDCRQLSIKPPASLIRIDLPVHPVSAVDANKENNWVQTIQGTAWNTLLRLYGSLEPCFGKTWRPRGDRATAVIRAKVRRAKPRIPAPCRDAAAHRYGWMPATRHGRLDGAARYLHLCRQMRGRA